MKPDYVKTIDKITKIYYNNLCGLFRKPFFEG